MLKNTYLYAKIGADTAENEQHCAEILPIGPRVAARATDCPPEMLASVQQDRAYFLQNILHRCN